MSRANVVGNQDAKDQDDAVLQDSGDRVTLGGQDLRQASYPTPSLQRQIAREISPRSASCVGGHGSVVWNSTSCPLP